MKKLGLCRHNQTQLFLLLTQCSRLIAIRKTFFKDFFEALSGALTGHFGQILIADQLQYNDGNKIHTITGELKYKKLFPKYYLKILAVLSPLSNSIQF